MSRYSFNVNIRVTELSPEMRELFGLEPAEGITVRRLSPEEIRRVRMGRFDEYEEL